MTTFDFSPYFRSTIGFDRIANLLDLGGRLDEGQSYPPYNIEKTGEDSYRITMAVAGFAEDDLAIVARENTLMVSGKARQPDQNVEFLYRGIAGRAFERRFSLADYVKVAGATLRNGMLVIDLVREVPEAMKPRSIPIGPGEGPRVISGKAA